MTWIIEEPIIHDLDNIFRLNAWHWCSPVFAMTWIIEEQIILIRLIISFLFQYDRFIYAKVAHKFYRLNKDKKKSKLNKLDKRLLTNIE